MKKCGHKSVILSVVKTIISKKGEAINCCPVNECIYVMKLKKEIFIHCLYRIFLFFGKYVFLNEDPYR